MFAGAGEACAEARAQAVRATKRLTMLALLALRLAEIGVGKSCIA
jgi:hypothetical protein